MEKIISAYLNELEEENLVSVVETEFLRASSDLDVNTSLGKWIKRTLKTKSEEEVLREIQKVIPIDIESIIGYVPDTEDILRYRITSSEFFLTRSEEDYKEEVRKLISWIEGKEVDDLSRPLSFYKNHLVRKGLERNVVSAINIERMIKSDGGTAN